MATPSNFNAVMKHLEAAYGTPRRQFGDSVLEQLIATILSQNTSDVNSEKAFDELKRRFPKWEQVMNAEADDIADAIHSGGLARQKAPRIKAVLETVAREHGCLEMDFLNALSDIQATQWLERLPGVGPKTAACVLLFAMGRDAFPVDTHVERICKRLGFVSEKTSIRTLQDWLENQTPIGQHLSWHLLLIEHGRKTCKAQQPKCEICPVRDECNYFRRKKSLQPKRIPI